MKKLLLIITLLLAAVGASAQDFEFRGIPLNNTTTEAVGKGLVGKGFVRTDYKGHTFYRGTFRGKSAFVLIGPSDDGNFKGMTVTITGDIVEMTNYISDLSEDFNAKYDDWDFDMEFEDDTVNVYYGNAKSNGLADVVMLSYGLDDDSLEYKLDITYAVDM